MTQLTSVRGGLSVILKAAKRYRYLDFNFNIYAEAVLKFKKLNTQSQQRGAIVQGRNLSPYRLRYNNYKNFKSINNRSKEYENE
ncbi:MAG: hypothetical protein LBK06_08635 [Planctomycetaceae bacterium]|nr:hypothetical protein [Planctomycetaceae bacterium]